MLAVVYFGQYFGHAECVLQKTVRCNRGCVVFLFTQQGGLLEAPHDFMLAFYVLFVHCIARTASAWCASVAS